MHIKDFEGWGKLKSNIDKFDRTNTPTINEREIWWCSIGVNIGDEEDGKNHLYNRPVLILKKFNNRIFWGLPLTSSTKKKNNYFLVDFKGKQQSVMLSHLRLYDAKRLHGLSWGRLPEAQFKSIKKALSKLLE
ncbi:type II toxin-antitoxin system PemK/MazF family toxin [uncultured Nostoc sp.]|uniref:type II toxin-antitoxin system PemK/MazF family toxin n=1 Tax=uncultured Nostoc sp. TaxID=340711 RepID=UPI0035CB2F58